MRKEVALAPDVEELDLVAVSNNAASACCRKSFGGDDLPVVVRVVVGVACDLLT